MSTTGFNVQDEVIRELIEAIKRKFSMKPKVAFAGFGNSGKSSLFNAVYGEKVASVSMKTDETTPENMKTKERFGIDFTDTPGFGTEKFAFHAIEPLLQGQHVVVHVLNGASAISDDDHVLHRMLDGSTARGITVVNKADVLDDSERKDTTTSVQEKLGLSPEQFLFVSAKRGENVPTLVNWIAERLPGAMRDAFIAQQQADQELKQRQIRTIIQTGAGSAAVVALMPIPVADIAILTPLQIAMVAKIAGYHGHTLSDAGATEFMAVVGAGYGLREIARQLVKLIPVGGSVISAAIAYGGTYALGEAANAWFESDMKMPPDELKEVYRRAEQSAKQQYEAKPKETAITVSGQGAATADLRKKYENGEITAEQFGKELLKLQIEA